MRLSSAGRNCVSGLVEARRIETRARGLARLSLETGHGPAFDAALALYVRFGFVPCGPFAGYTRDPFSRFFSLEL